MAEPSADIAPGRGVEFGLLGRSGIEEFLRFHPGRRREYIERRLSTGDLCFTARHESALVSTTWACRSKHWVPDLHYMWHVAPGEVYLYDSYTDPQHRGEGLSPALKTHILRYFRNLEVERALTVVAPENAACLCSNAKAGFRPCGDLRCFSIGWGLHLHRRRGFASASTASPGGD